MHESRSSGLLVCFAFCRYSTVPLSLLLVFLFTGGWKQERKEGGKGKRGGGGESRSLHVYCQFGGSDETWEE